jgi:peptide-methionine (S)-S-oxide reductase
MAELKLPCDESAIRNLRVGETALLSGRIITGRDTAHHWLCGAFREEVAPFLQGSIIYHCGPVVRKNPDGSYTFVAAGPTTSAREEPYQADVLERYGVRGVIGKGGMFDKTRKGLQKCGAVYLHAVGGTAQSLAKPWFVSSACSSWKSSACPKPCGSSTSKTSRRSSPWTRTAAPFTRLFPTKGSAPAAKDGKAFGVADGERAVAILAGGCFWGMEDILRAVPGVISTEVGYAGGTTARPSYQEVCTGRTGHAEAVQVVFDPRKLAYADLLRLFFRMHDPTTLNRQSHDVGTQYRSAIFVVNEEQRRIAEDTKAEVERSGKWQETIVTEIAPASDFYAAEDDHQGAIHGPKK